MKILFLGDENSPLVSHLEQMGENVLSMTEKVTVDFVDAHHPEFIISYGYRHIIKQEILDRYVDRAINLHISFLPWNSSNSQYGNNIKNIQCVTSFAKS